MKILRQQPGAFKQDIQVETAIMKLGLVCNLPENTSYFTPDAFNKMLIEISLTTALHGSKVILPKMSVRDAFDIASMGEGFFVWGLSKIKGQIVIADHGSLVLQNGDMISISYEGFPDACTTDLYAIDSPAKTNIFCSIEEIVVTGTKDLNISDKTEIFFPVTDALGNGIDKIQLQYADKTVTVDEEELKFINDSVNDISCVRQEQDVVTGLPVPGIYPVRFGFDRLLKLDVTHAYSVIITPKTKTPISVYTNKSKAI